MVLQAITWYLMVFNNIRWYCMVFDGIAGYYMVFIGISPWLTLNYLNFPQVTLFTLIYSIIHYGFPQDFPKISVLVCPSLSWSVLVWYTQLTYIPQIVGSIYSIQIYISTNLYSPTLRPKGAQKLQQYMQPPSVGLIYPIPTYIFNWHLFPKLLAAYIYILKMYIPQPYPRTLIPSYEYPTPTYIFNLHILPKLFAAYIRNKDIFWNIYILQPCTRLLAWYIQYQHIYSTDIYSPNCWQHIPYKNIYF